MSKLIFAPLEAALACVRAQPLEAPELSIQLLAECWEAEPVALRGPSVGSVPLTPRLYLQESLRVLARLLCKSRLQHSLPASPRRCCG